MKRIERTGTPGNGFVAIPSRFSLLLSHKCKPGPVHIVYPEQNWEVRERLNTRMKIAVVLAAISGVLLAGAGSLAYAQSATQQSGQASCKSMMNQNEGMGMMGGMSHYGSMTQSQCNSHMGQLGMGQCQDLMASRDSTQPYTMMDQNTTGVCY